MSLVGAVFWFALAIAFLALAGIASIESRATKQLEHPFGGITTVHIPTPSARALRRILLVESAGFVLAAAAAAFEWLAS